MNGRYQGKRFASFLVATAALLAAFFGAHPDSFGAFSTAIAGLYGAYLAGQSVTDYAKVKNGNSA